MTGGDKAEALLPSRDEVALGTTLMSNPEVVDWLSQKIHNRIPAAIVRFGDSEARVLAAGRDWYPVTQAMELLERETGTEFAPDEIAELQALIAKAFDEADLLGIRFRARFASAEKQQTLATLAARYSTRIASEKPPAIMARSLVSYALIEPLAELLSGRPVSVISCRDLQPLLEDEWKTGEVTVYQAPSQWGFRDVDGKYEKEMHGKRIWPDVHSQIRSRLRVREPGEVFLIGVGVFGKDLCIAVRRQGGIAVDMGSALDHMAGKLTRGPERKAIELHHAGMSVSEIVAEMQRKYQTALDEQTVAIRLRSILAEVEKAQRSS